MRNMGPRASCELRQRPGHNPLLQLSIFGTRLRFRLSCVDQTRKRAIILNLRLTEQDRNYIFGGVAGEPLEGLQVNDDTATQCRARSCADRHPSPSCSVCRSGKLKRVRHDEGGGEKKQRMTAAVAPEAKTKTIVKRHCQSLHVQSATASGFRGRQTPQTKAQWARGGCWRQRPSGGMRHRAIQD